MLHHTFLFQELHMFLLDSHTLNLCRGWPVQTRLFHYVRLHADQTLCRL